MRLPLYLAAALAAAAPLPAAAAPACRGTISGSVKGTFTCTASVTTRDDVVYFAIEAKGPIEGIPGYAPGAFELPGPPARGTLTLDGLGMGRASVAAQNGTLYSATKTSSQRGEVTLTLESVKPDRSRQGAWVVHGRYRARLLPAGAGKTGEVTVDVTF